MPKMSSDNNGPILGGMRIAKITYDHQTIRQAKDGSSIGAMVDMYLFEAAKRGDMIAEVSLFFETEEQQSKIRDYYSPSEATAI